MPKKIVKLDVQNEYDFLLLAIVCTQKDYRLCFELNTHFGMNLKRVADLEVVDAKQKSKTIFSNFFSRSRDGLEVRIINNKTSATAFIPEKKKIDYFIMIRNMPAGESVDKLIQNLKKISIISGVYEMDPNELKSGENFLLIE